MKDTATQYYHKEKIMFLKVLVRFTYLFIFLKKFSISFSLYFIFSPHLEAAFLFYSINTEHYFLVVATSKAADYSIYDISPLPCIAIMFYTRTHIFTFIFLFFIFFLFFLGEFIEWLFFYSSLQSVVNIVVKTVYEQ